MIALQKKALDKYFEYLLNNREHRNCMKIDLVDALGSVQVA